MRIPVEARSAEAPTCPDAVLVASNINLTDLCAKLSIPCRLLRTSVHFRRQGDLFKLYFLYVVLYIYIEGLTAGCQ